MTFCSSVSAYPFALRPTQRTNLDAIPDNVDLHEPLRDLQFGRQPDTEDANVDERDDSEDEPAQDVLRPKWSDCINAEQGIDLLVACPSPEGYRCGWR